MVVSLNPAQIAFQPQLEKGKLVRFGQGTGSALNFETLTFQFNPSTITRTRTGRWEPRQRRQRPVASPADIRARSASGSASLLAESETVGFKLVFDATEAILANRTDADRVVAETGILPELAFLDLISLGKEEQEERNRRGGGRSASARTRETVQPVRPDELLLVLGLERIFPVVLTSLTITEQKFSPTLMPIRAEADIRFNVLEPVENAYNTWIRNAFDQLFQRRKDLANQAIASSPESAADNAIANALQPRTGPASAGGAA
jgi:Contractile injection system tube protein